MFSVEAEHPFFLDAKKHPRPKRRASKACRDNMDIFDQFETSSELENKGVWLNFYGVTKVLVARQGGSNVDYLKNLSEELTKLGKTGTKAADFIEQSEIIRRVFCKSVIKGHQVKNDDGEFVDGVMVKVEGKKEILPYNLDNMTKMLDQLPEYYNAIKEYADDFKTFSASQLEEQEKN